MFFQCVKKIIILKKIGMNVEVSSQQLGERRTTALAQTAHMDCMRINMVWNRIRAM